MTTVRLRVKQVKGFDPYRCPLCEGLISSMAERTLLDFWCKCGDDLSFATTKKAILSGKVPFSISCSCGRDQTENMQTYKQAKKAGWTNINYDPLDPFSYYVGTCPDCKGDDE